MTTTDIVYEILSGYSELTAGAIHKKCAGKAGISNKKAVSNALTRLKKDGRVESVYDEDKGLWMWNVIRSETDACQSPDAGDHSEHDLEMASDVTEVNQPLAKDCISIALETSNVVNHDAECRAKPRKPYTPNKIAGAYTYRGALVIKLDRKAHAKSITLSAKDMAMLTSIFGGTA